MFQTTEIVQNVSIQYLAGAFKFGAFEHLSYSVERADERERERETIAKGATNGAFPGVKGGSQRYMKWRKREQGVQRVGGRRKGYFFESLISRVSTLT